MTTRNTLALEEFLKFKFALTGINTIRTKEYNLCREIITGKNWFNHDEASELCRYQELYNKTDDDILEKPILECDYLATFEITDNLIKRTIRKKSTNEITTDIFKIEPK